MQDLEAAVEAIYHSRKYQDLCVETIRDVLTIETGRHRSLKEALPHAKRRLHRLWASFLGEPDYRAARAALEKAFAQRQDAEIHRAVRALLEVHASAAERLPDLPDLYQQLFARTGVPGRLADLACALNPLSFRWMGLPRSIQYRAYDINRSTVELVNDYFRLEGLAELAEWRDVLCSPPSEEADVALLLKMYHCLEHRRKGAGWLAVEAAPARWVAVSFPTRNLHARIVDIRGNYEPALRANATARGWAVEELVFPSEVVLLVEKR